MSTRHLYVILFVFLFSVTVISYLLLREVLWWPRSFFLYARRRAYIITTFHSLLIFSSSRRLHRLSPNRSRLYKGGYIHCFSYHIVYFIICQFVALFPLVTSQAWLRSDVLEPQPGVTTGESRKFLALGVLDRFPAVPSASLHRLGFMSWLRWLGS